MRVMEDGDEGGGDGDEGGGDGEGCVDATGDHTGLLTPHTSPPVGVACQWPSGGHVSASSPADMRGQYER